MSIFSPVLMSLMSRKYLMTLGGVITACYCAVFIKPIPALLYVFSALSGCGAAFLWIGRGSEFVLNSTKKTLHRNASIFFAMYMSGSFGGNVYVFFAWKGRSIINQTEQNLLAIIMSCITLLGALCFLLLKNIDDGKAKKQKDVGEELKTYLFR